MKVSVIILIAFTLLHSDLVSARASNYNNYNYNDNNEKKIVCFYRERTALLAGKGNCRAKCYKPALTGCTHLIYQNAGISGSKMVPGNTTSDVDMRGYLDATDMKQKFPDLKVLVVLGGPFFDPAIFSVLAADDNQRKKFAQSAVKFLQKYNFDGIELEWEFPNPNNTKPSDRENHSKLVKDLHSALKSQKGQEYELHVGLTPRYMARTYDVKEFQGYVDYINLFGYDMHLPEDSVTGHNGPLYPSLADRTEKSQQFNIHAGVQYLLRKGVPPRKILAGVGAYGLSYILEDPDKNTVGSPVIGPHPPGPIYGQEGFLGTMEICRFVKKYGWTEEWDHESKVPYAFKGNKWVSYDNIKSVEIKADYIIKNGLGGANFYSLDYDDHIGSCYGQKFPLLIALQSLRGGPFYCD